MQRYRVYVISGISRVVLSLFCPAFGAVTFKEQLRFRDVKPVFTAYGLDQLMKMRAFDFHYFLASLADEVLMPG